MRSVVKFENQHGLIMRTHDIGKTVTLQMLAEVFSEIGATMFLSKVRDNL